MHLWETKKLIGNHLSQALISHVTRSHVFIHSQFTQKSMKEQNLF